MSCLLSKGPVSTVLGTRHVSGKETASLPAGAYSLRDSGELQGSLCPNFAKSRIFILRGSLITYQPDHPTLRATDLKLIPAPLPSPLEEPRGEGLFPPKGVTKQFLIHKICLLPATDEHT